jgi:hypothetical protein
MAITIEDTRTVFHPPAPRTGEEWRALREASGLGVGQLARRAGVSTVTLWKLEHDRPVGEMATRLVYFALGCGPYPGPEPTLWGQAS